MDISRWIERHAAFVPDKVALRFRREFAPRHRDPPPQGRRSPEGRGVGQTARVSLDSTSGLPPPAASRLPPPSGEDPAGLTYAGLFGQVRAIARGLAAAGLSRGDVVAWWGLNAPDMIALLFAVARQGLVLAPVNWRLADEEIGFLLKHSGAKAVFVEQAFAAKAGALDLPARGLRVIGADFAAPGIPSLADFARGDGPERDASLTGAEPVLLGFTSGTTGRPKGAILTQDALTWNAVNSQHMHDMTAADHVLTVLPMFHVGGLCIQTLPALHLAATVTVFDRFHPGRVLAAIAADRPSLTVLVPTTMAAMLADPGFAASDLTALRAIATGSTDVPVQHIEAFRARGVPVIQVYGATETGPLAIYQRIADAHRVGTIGKPALHAEIRLVDGEGRDCPPGVAGEILVKGPAVTAGYWQDAQATGAALADGWFRSGDVAHRDEEGWYWFRDRIKNVIISGGENIYPAELERVLAECPAILEAAIVGRPDPRWGETPVAVVVAAESATLTKAEILALFDGRLARFKHPRDVLLLDRLPRNAMGKVETAILRRQVVAGNPGD